MPSNEMPVEIHSRDYRFKIFHFLQQNWALIDGTTDGCTIFFFGDNSGVFKRLSFPSISETKRLFAEMALLVLQRTKKPKGLLPSLNHHFMIDLTRMGQSIRPAGSRVEDALYYQL